jgi:peptidyl-prolyl cis-trans isomerase D
MIYIFRKEMKKWHTVLWVVFVSLAIGSGITFVWKVPGSRSDHIGLVNGRAITLEQYRHALNEIQGFLRQLGPSGEFLLHSINPEEVAFDTCVKETLLDTIKDRFNIQIANEVFKDLLLRSIPEAIADETGCVNADIYQRYVSQFSMTTAEFESHKEEEFKRHLVSRCVEQASYIPDFITRDLYETKHLKKRFGIVIIPEDLFVHEVEQQPLDEKALKDFFEKNKENYRTQEKRKAMTWSISTETYAQKIEIDEQAIRHFYERNKSRLYRIAPKVKVRHIVIKGDNKKADEIHKKVKTHPETFAQVAAQVSQDPESAKNGGQLDFFARGTYEDAFETAAFRLHKPGEISDLIATPKGYEIIQLMERQAASERPIESVKDEIIKTLKAKKTVATLRGDLELMIHEARQDESRFNTFVKDLHLDGQESEWLTAKAMEQQGLMGMLAQRLFGSYKKQTNLGYFMIDNTCVLYRLTGEQKSVIPTFNEVRQDVVHAYQAQRADDRMKEMVHKIRVDILAHKATLPALAEQFRLKYITTGLVKPGDALEGIDHDSGLGTRVFVLTDKSQLLYQEQKEHGYLVQLLESEPYNQGEYEKVKGSLTKTEMAQNRGRAINSFIASLQRNAKIERSGKLEKSKRI